MTNLVPLSLNNRFYFAIARLMVAFSAFVRELFCALVLPALVNRVCLPGSVCRIGIKRGSALTEISA